MRENGVKVELFDNLKSTFAKPTCSTVIASEAKQSMPQHEERWIAPSLAPRNDDSRGFA